MKRTIEVGDLLWLLHDRSSLVNISQALLIFHFTRGEFPSSLAESRAALTPGSPPKAIILLFDVTLFLTCQNVGVFASIVVNWHLRTA